MRGALLALTLLVGCESSTGEAGRVLAFSRTNGHRHAESIAAALAVLPERLAHEGLALDATEEPFRDLAGYRAVILYTSGNDVLDEAGKTALEEFVRGGGGWLGVHSAADTEYAWPFYGSLVVAHFADHPGVQTATMTIAEPEHPAMAALPAGPWVATDEWYNFATDPRETDVAILATVDESTYSGGTMGADHPLIWAHERLGGRAVYTAIGHPAERWQEAAFVDHIVDAVRWVSGL